MASRMMTRLTQGHAAITTGSFVQRVRLATGNGTLRMYEGLFSIVCSQNAETALIRAQKGAADD